MLSARQLFLAHQAQTSHFPLLLEIVKAEGNYLYDIHQKKYLDLISGISVSSYGHGNPAIIQAIKEQADKYLHLMVYGEFVQYPQVELAQLLCGYLPESLQSVYLVNSGAEAVEGAMKLAKRVSGRQHIVAMYRAYHGSTQGALSLNSESYFKEKFEPLLPGIQFIRFNEEADLALLHEDIAAVFIEPIQGEAGYLAADPDYLYKLRQRCNELDILLVFDEIQSGMGRSGSMFAFENYGIIPDILLLGKALGAGMPMGAFISSREKMILLADQPVLGHITTFGGHPLAAAAAVAGIKQLQEQHWIEQVAVKETLFRTELAELGLPISGKGLMLGIQMPNQEQTLRVIQACIADGLITDWFLFAPDKIRLAPPLTITESEIKWACAVIRKHVLN